METPLLAPQNNTFDSEVEIQNDLVPLDEKHSSGVPSSDSAPEGAEVVSARQKIIAQFGAVVPLFFSSLGLAFLCTIVSLIYPKYVWVSALGQGQAALFTSYICFLSLKKADDKWIARVRIAWIAFGVASILFALGCISYAWLLVRNPPKGPSISDWFWMAQQPVLWAGLFLLAWRGQSLGLMRLLTDSIIVVMSMIVLAWSMFLEKILLDPQATLGAKIVALYYPIWDSAHLFALLVLVANVRGRPGLARAACWLFAGVGALIVSDSLHAYYFQTRSIAASPYIDLIQTATFPLIGIAALIHSSYARFGDQADQKSSDEDVVDSASFSLTNAVTPWEQRLGRWHRSAMLWLPYIATLGVSGTLIGQELQKANSETIQRVLPVLALLMAIVARQMITLWDNLKLAERLRTTNEALENNVYERTRHLTSLHGITSMLNTSLDRRTVLRVTLEKTIAAVRANGGGIWLRDSRRDVYTDAAPGDEWSLVHWQGTEESGMISMLRELSIAEAEADNAFSSGFNISPATREAMQHGIAPPAQRLIRVPIRWQGKLLGVMGLMRDEGAFSYEDRALVESVAYEAGTALQNARLYSEAAHRADRDSVTDLFNHRAIQEQLNQMLSRCKRIGGSFSIVMMDLNNFKFFNDTYGHPVGDDVLRAVARGLKESCRTSDVLGRYGGDEFIVLLPDTDASGTLDACQRIKIALDARHFEPVPGTRLPIATSFGWATYPHDGDNVLELLTTADQNLYKHKRGGASYLSQTAKAARESNDELKKLKNRAIGGSFGVLDALVTAIDNKDHYTRHHSEEVTFLSLLLARELGYTAEQLQAVRISGLLHDVGKIAVPDEILRHPGKLERDQWDIMQQHPVFGALIVKDVPQLDRVIDGIKYHHEKWDGSGYPESLKGEAIPEMGRLLALADCYSALTTDRPYRKGWKPEAALEEIERCAGTHFDPRICEAFLRVMRAEIAVGADSVDYGSRIADRFSDEALVEK
jgi:diguanylate cyclase (GGDEF)-like protein/putative nucleotidyltransferase with HDIG domain